MAIWSDIDPSIQRRARGILLRMKMLSEGPARGIVLYAAHAADPDHAPKATGSLFEEWLPRFGRAADDRTLSAVCIRGETAIARWRGQYRAELELPSDDDAAMKKVVELCAGLDPVEVSRKMAGKVSPGWVENARRRNRRDTATGERLMGWAGMSDEDRLGHVHHAVDQGWTLRKAAERCGVPKSTLHRQYGHYFSA